MSHPPQLGPRGQGWVALQALTFAIIGLGAMAGPAWSGALRAATGAVGVALLLGGVGLAGWALTALGRGRALTPLPYPRDEAELVDDGPYRLVRHPVYGGLIVAGLGWGLLTASLVSLAGAVALLVLFDLKSRREEVWLEERFAGYAAYRSRTRRLLPGVY